MNAYLTIFMTVHGAITCAAGFGRFSIHRYVSNESLHYKQKHENLYTLIAHFRHLTIRKIVVRNNGCAMAYATGLSRLLLNVSHRVTSFSTKSLVKTLL